MEVDNDEPFDLVASHFEREFNLSIDREESLGDDYIIHLRKGQESIEREVNQVKQTISELCAAEEDRRKWRMNTQKTHLMGGLGRRLGKRYSNAFCKFYQILARFPELIKPGMERGVKSTTFNSLHLCEVPGHFLSAIEHFIAIFSPDLKWEWMANSLNPHYEYTKGADMFLDDQLIVDHPDRWIFGDDNSGDVTKLASTLRKSNKRFDLVTADGSTYSLDHPEDQESIVFDILVGEVECALSCLRDGGSFIMKVYSSFTMESSRLFALLINLFDKVVIYKPPSSKSGNTERYMICVGFKKVICDYSFDTEVRLKESVKHVLITKQIGERILVSSRFFSALQIQSMENNIDLFTSPSLSSMEVNILVDRAIERVMRDCRMSILKEADVSSSLFCNREYRPWTELFKDNHVERLKELEDPERAEQMLRAKQVEWLMADEGEMLVDVCTEVEWDKELLDLFHNDAPLLLVHPKGDPPILHSLFVDPELWVALRSIHPESVIDVCKDGEVMPISVSKTFLDMFQRDERGFIKITEQMVPSQIDWIKMLIHLHSRIESFKVTGNHWAPGITLVFPSSTDSTPLFLSRFSVSIVAMLTFLFFRVNIPHPKRDSEFIIEFDLPNYPEDIPDFLGGYLQRILKRMNGGEKCLSFVPLRFQTELYSLISFYNNEMIKKVIGRKLQVAC